MLSSSKERIAQMNKIGAWSNDTLHGLLARHVQERGGVIAVADQPNRAELADGYCARLTYAELDRASDGLAVYLLDAGLQRDDFVILQMPNIVELVLCYYAASKIGLIVSPVPIQYGAHELSHVCQTLKPKAMITCERFHKTALRSRAKDTLPQLRVLSWGRDLPSLEALCGSGEGARARVRAQQQEQHNGADDILTVCWTSGTTGTPKGVPRSHNMWFASARGTALAGNYQAGDRLLAPFPMVNMAVLAGFLFSSAIYGCSIYLHHPFDAQLYLKQMEEEQIQYSVTPPAVLNQLARDPALWEQYDFHALRGLGSGSAPLAPWMIEAFEHSYGVPITNFYGSNEGIGLYSTPESSPTAETRASMFPRPGASRSFYEAERPGVRAKVADPDTGEEIRDPGCPGELLIAGPTVFDGYYDHDNVGVFSEDGYFRTGDLVEICGDAPDYPYYRIVGRCKDIINRGGMKISPVELDLLLEGYPGVKEAAVCAYPDERLGEKICACLVLEGEEVPELPLLQQWLLDKGLAKFKLPERIYTLSLLPRNPVGKVQRFSLEELVRAE